MKNSLTDKEKQNAIRLAQLLDVNKKWKNANYLQSHAVTSSTGVSVLDIHVFYQMVKMIESTQEPDTKTRLSSLLYKYMSERMAINTTKSESAVVMAIKQCVESYIIDKMKKDDANYARDSIVVKADLVLKDLIEQIDTLAANQSSTTETVQADLITANTGMTDESKQMQQK